MAKAVIHELGGHAAGILLHPLLEAIVEIAPGGGAVQRRAGIAAIVVDRESVAVRGVPLESVAIPD